MNGLIAIFTTVLNLSITASYVAAGVMLIRWFLRKAPKVYVYALWSAVLVRMITPVTFTAAFSLFGILGDGVIAGGQASLVFVPQNIGQMEQPAIHSGFPTIDRTVNMSLPEATPTNSANPLQIGMTIASVVWAAGVMALLAYGVASYWKTLFRVRTATRLKGQIYETDRIVSPFVLGFVRPKIYVPAGLDAEQLQYIEAHELEHIRRKDHWIKPFAFLAVTVHWFNPLMWLSFALMSKDMEMSCDERVLKSMGSEAKYGYSRVLLSLAADRRSWLRGSPLAFGESAVASRIKNMLIYKKPRRQTIALAFISTLALVAALTANPRPASLLSETSDFGMDEVRVLSSGQIRVAGGSFEVYVEMVDGKYYTEDEVGPGGGTYPENYEGTYRLRVVQPELSARENTVFVYDRMADDFGGQLNFSGSFNLVWDDYNGDGQPDFTLGQWAGSNGNIYNLYTQNDRGQIVRLDTGGEMYMAERGPSVRLEKIDDTRFTTSYYDQIEGSYKQRVYEWNGTGFGKSEH